MELLTFPMLVTQLGVNETELQNMGFDFSYSVNDNLYRDEVSINSHDYFKHYYFTIEHRKWDLHREFTLQSTNSRRFYYRLDPINGNPIRINKDNFYYENEMPPDLEQFAQGVLDLLHEVFNKIQNDNKIFSN